jgi:lauroyl/myristoyl acyltransferase
VLNLVLPVDWGPLDTQLARGRGVLLSTAHWGVPNVLTALLSASGRPSIQVALWFKRRRSPGTKNPHGDSQSGLTRLYLQAFQRLRAGGIAIIAPDGGRWRESSPERFFGHPCRVSLAPAALTRLTGAPSLPVMSIWEEGRIRIHFGPVLEPESGAGEAADRRWMRRYLDWLEGMARAHPRATRLDQLNPRLVPPSETADVDR